MQPAIAVVQSLQHSLAAASSRFDLTPPGQTAAPFAGFMQQSVEQMAQLRSDANEKVRGLMNGDGTDIHTAMIATQKADLAFDLALSVRNKAIGAYQQLMSMQF